MPIPTFTGLGPDPQYEDIVNKVNTLVAELRNLMLTLDSLNVVSLTADHVDTGTLNANLVTIRSDLLGTSYLQLDGNGIRANNGLIDTFEIGTDGNAYFRGELQAASGTFTGVLQAQHAIIGSTSTPSTINIQYGTNKYIQLQASTTTSGETYLQGFASSPGGAPSNLARADFLATLLNFGTGTNFIEFQTDTGLITSTFLRTRSSCEINGTLDMTQKRIDRVGEVIYHYHGLTPLSTAEGSLQYGDFGSGTGLYFRSDGVWYKLGMTAVL